MNMLNSKIIIILVLLTVATTKTTAGITVAMIKSWGGSVPVIEELNKNWASYGTIPLTIDTTLMDLDSFTYQDLVNTNAEVIWLSDPSGGTPYCSEFTSNEVAAVQRYVNEGHSIFGTFLVFQYVNVNHPIGDADNRGLAPIFGLRQDIDYIFTSANQSFDTSSMHPLFNNINNPYISDGYEFAQVPADDLKWDAEDLGNAQLLSNTPDRRGVITWYETASYHAVYISEMVEYRGNQADTQFIYNALTIPEPASIALLALSGLAMFHPRQYNF